MKFRSPSSLSLFQHRRGLFWLIGVAAVLMHTLAAMGGFHVARAADNRVTFELCTSHGLVTVDAGVAGNPSPTSTATHTCCDLCSSGGMALVANTSATSSLAAPRLLIRSQQDDQAPEQRFWIPHLARGPPALV